MGVNMTNDNFLKGQCLSDGNPYINTIPRKWTDSEIEYMLKLKSSGKTIKEICTILERSEASVSVKLKRLKKKDGNYNEKHLTEKVDINKQFVEYIKPNSILDVYARDGNVAYTNYNVISNDIDSSCETTYHMDAFDLLCTLYLDKEKFEDRDFKENTFIDLNELRMTISPSNALSDNKFVRLVKTLDPEIKTSSLTIRQLMQMFGSNVMRQFFGDKI